MSREAGSARGGKKKIMFTLAILVLVFGVAACLKVQAGTGENGAGWLGGWSDDGAGNSTGVGWVNTNCASQVDITGDKIPDEALKICNGGINDLKLCNIGNPAAVGCGVGSCEDACTVLNARGIDVSNTDYGLNIPTGDGDLTGYAWSENIGWINFNSGDLNGCPSGICSARRVTTPTDHLEGWARIIGIKSEYEKVPSNSGGWQGWVKLNGIAQDGSPYGVSISGGQLQGFGWSGNDAAPELGWIDFSKASIIAPKTITASISATPSIVSDSATPVSIAANVTGGTATGDMVYELDCDNSGTFTDGKFPASGTTGDLSHEFANACTYSATSTVAVRITRDGVSVTPTASVIFGCIDNYCDTNFQCKTQLKDSGCNAICDTTTCKAPQNANWKEVAP